MSGTVTAGTPLPEIPESAGEKAEVRGGAGDVDLPAKHKRSRRRRFVVPVVLGLIGVVLFLFGYGLYPSAATDVATPLYARLGVSATFPLSLIGVTVLQTSPALAEIKVTVELPAGTDAPPAGAAPAALVFAPPLGTSFPDCPPPFCKTIAGPTAAAEWGMPLNFSYTGGSAAEATADFFVKAQHFGVNFDGVNAVAAIPEVLYAGPRKPMLLISYHIPSAATYDWSSFPAAAVSRNAAIWQEDVLAGDTPGRAAVGINPAGQASHDNNEFLAGALIGLAGGAILSAVQEALHGPD